MATYTAGLRRLANEGMTATAASADIRVTGVTSAYTFSAAHATMAVANVPSAARVFSSGALALSLADGTLPRVRQLNCSPPTISGVPAGSNVVGYIVYFHAAALGDSIPLAFIDGADVTPQPLATNGNNVTLTFATGLVAIANQAP